MVKNNLHLWFNQISYQKKNGFITYGLTIPYLIGSYLICNQILSDNPIKSIILEIVESNLEKCAVLQKCPNISQYVIGIDDREFCELYMKKQIVFKNSAGRTSLFITQNANELGNDLNNIIEHFDNLYCDCIANENYSWNNMTKNWTKFTKYEVDLIEQGK